MKITPSTRIFTLLGDPVAHSLSPRFQNAGFQAAGLDAVYLAQACSAQELPTLMHSLSQNGGGGNITVPHKEAACRVGHASARVNALGAANTFVGRADGIHLANTDVDGVLHALDLLEAPSSAWLVIGTGGSARAVVGAAAERGASIAVRSRSPERASGFLSWAATLGVDTAPAEACTVVINATPLGLGSADPLPLQVSEFPNLQFSLDLVYRIDGTTPWIDACHAQGITAIDGRETLLAQGAASWALWFPGLTPPWDVMRAALNGRMG